MKLIIVESPAKARTIEKFLGDGYLVSASYGHIRDLPSSSAEIPASCKGESWARMGVDIDDGYRPVYVVTPDSRKHVNELKKLLKKADELLLATDEDREGEAISWHILEELDPSVPVRRITFHEITKSAIQAALAAPREVDLQLVRAQEGRRILDRLFGYTLSPVLWKRVRTKLSAGRVQSVALRLIVELEESRLRFRRSDYWDAEAGFRDADGTAFTAKLHKALGRRPATGKDFDPDTGALKESPGVVLLDETATQGLVEACRGALPWTVGNVERKASHKRPSPPFTTSTLQQAASSRLGMSPRRTMQTAQRLYEGIELGSGGREGLITYMRTDSLTLSEEALKTAERVIRANFGDEYTTGPRRYRTQAKGAQEAHEAIRPTSLERTPESVARFLDKEQRVLYELIWRRTVASQMADAVLDRTTADLHAATPDGEYVFRATGSVVRFPGFLRVAGGDDRDKLLPELSPGQEVGRAGDPAVLETLVAEHHETQPPARFTEASLIKRLEEEGIGRPSTYAPTVSTIQNRDYAVKKGSALVPTYVGMAVIQFLRRHFDHYIDLGFTARMESELDGIASGEIDLRTFLDAFYRGDGAAETGLVNAIAAETPAMDYPAIDIGPDPETGAPMRVRIGRTTAYLQSGEGDDARRVTLPVDLFIDELDPARAHELLMAKDRSRDPIGVDPDSGLNIYVLTGPFGPYIQLGEMTDDGPKPKRVSLGKGTDPARVDLDTALRLLSLPRVIGACPETGKPVRAGLGRFGPYVERQRIFASLDDMAQLFTVTLEEAIARIVNKNRKTVLKDLGEHPETGAPLQVFKGRYGPYVTDGKVNATIPGEDPTAVTVEEALALLAEAAQRKSKKKPVRKKAATTKKKTAKKTAPKKKAATKKKTVTKKKTATKKTTRKKTS